LISRYKLTKVINNGINKTTISNPAQGLVKKTKNEKNNKVTNGPF